MNKYVLMLAAAGLMSAAPAYYAFQAQAEEVVVAPASEEAAPAVDCAAIPEGTEAPAECAEMAVEAAPSDESHEGHEGH